jgi:hypothetical protein
MLLDMKEIETEFLEYQRSGLTFHRSIKNPSPTIKTMEMSQRPFTCFTQALLLSLAFLKKTSKC